MVSMFDTVTQVVVLGFLAFAGPGLFNALQGLGAAGSGDPATAAAANGTLYGVFAVVGYFSGVFFNILGPRPCLFVGGFTFAIYSICMFYSTEGVWIAAIGGCILGCGAGVFWTAQSALMLAYATENEKGKFTAIFWAMLQLGACLGGFLQMGLNWKYFTEDEGGLYTVSGAKASALAYWTFIVIMCLGSLSSLIILAPVKKVRKSDGTEVKFEKASSAKVELKAAAAAITDPFVWKMFMYFFYSNWYYTFEFGAINGFFFNSRAAGMNSAMYPITNICGAQFLGRIADNKKWDIKKRAKISFFTNLFVFSITWTLAIVTMYTAANGKVDKELTTYNPDDLDDSIIMSDDNQIIYDLATWDQKVDDDGNRVFSESSLIYRLAWFPGNQISYVDPTITIEDGCEWLTETRKHFRNVGVTREECFKMNEMEGEGHTDCLWDIYQCVDMDKDQYGRAMMDIVKDEAAPLCDLYQTDVCVTFNADYVSNEILPIITFMVMGFSDACFQTYVYWLIGTMAGPSVGLSVKYAACYKGIQSLGACVAWLTDLIPSFLYRYQAIVNAILGGVSLIGSLSVVAVIEKTRFTGDAEPEVASQDKDKEIALSKSSSSSDNE